MKANFYKLAKLHHPDRVPETQKHAAKERFNLIHHAYSVLSNVETKAIYDEGETHFHYSQPTVAAKWEQYVKTVETEDIESARARYQHSSAEEVDVLREFIVGKGSMTHLLNVIPFMRIDDETRILEFLKQTMQNGKIQKIPIRKIRR